MTFRVSARTVLQLGAELISSDAVAFYELIKNAFDAGSPKISIHVVVRLPDEAIREAHELVSAGSNSRQAILDCTQSLIDRLDLSIPSAGVLRDRLLKVDAWADLQPLLDEANFIEIVDTGLGMSLKDLEDIFLTIGTRARLKERDMAGPQSAAKRPILGEKGLGRLSAMRLGWKLRVLSSKSGEQNWNVLEIDWRQFSHESDAMLEEICIAPMKGDKKTDSELSGTRLRISALTAGWNEEKVQEIAADQFSKLTDPFVPDSQYPIVVTFNDRPVTIHGFDTILHEYASAEVHAEFQLHSPTGPRLFGRINYKLRGREKTFELEGAHLISSAKLPAFHVLHTLGPFITDFTWINRKALREMQDDVGEVHRAIALQKKWAGGLMVYRDGFRVYPYGSSDDDWLDLDKRALSSGGYKVNRRQVIGKVDISSTANPALLDQSNREGLRDCPEKQALILLLKYILESEFLPFLNAVDKEVRATEPTTFEDLTELIDESQSRIAESLRGLVVRHPAIAEDGELVLALQSAIKDVRRRLEDAKALAKSFELEHAQVVHLAATGLLVEMLAHELNRATGNALATLMNAGQQKLFPQGESFLSALQAELKTLQRRLRILDPLGTPGRQRKEVFELVEWVKEIMTTHSPQLERHGIQCIVREEPKGGTLKIKAVKGMIVQILGNLVTNSAYWLKQERKVDRQLKPKIVIIIDTTRKSISFSDNGPGIPTSRKTDVFQPFVTTKPPGEGKGLGLYIAREIARYNNAALSVSEESTVHPGRLNTFLLTLDGAKA